MDAENLGRLAPGLFFQQSDISSGTKEDLKKNTSLPALLTRSH